MTFLLFAKELHIYIQTSVDFGQKLVGGANSHFHYSIIGPDHLPAPEFYNQHYLEKRFRDIPRMIVDIINR